MRCAVSAVPPRPHQSAGTQTAARSSQFQEALLDLHDDTPDRPLRLSDIPGITHAYMCIGTGWTQDAGSCHTVSARGLEFTVLCTGPHALLDWGSEICTCENLALTGRNAIQPWPVSTVSEDALELGVREGCGDVPTSLGSRKINCRGGRPLSVSKAQPAVRTGL